MSSHDCLNKFLLQDRSARVIAVQMNEVWQVALANQPKNPAVRQLLGELMSAASLLSANLKFNGSLMLQLQGNGAIKLMVVECRQDLSMRATVKLNDTDIPDDANLQSLLNPDGQGRFSVILNPPRDTPGSQPYQGIVPLQAGGVSQALEDYMRQSEQLETHLWLAASQDRIAVFCCNACQLTVVVTKPQRMSAMHRLSTPRLCAKPSRHLSCLPRLARH